MRDFRSLRVWQNMRCTDVKRMLTALIQKLTAES
jgi:hypothetical protein